MKSSILHPNQLKKSEGRAQGNLLRDTPSNKHTHNQITTPIQHDNFELSNVDFVTSNAKSSQFGAMLYILEDNEAVIKNDHNGKKPYNETCFQNPQSCS